MLTSATIARTVSLLLMYRYAVFCVFRVAELVEAVVLVAGVDVAGAMAEGGVAKVVMQELAMAKSWTRKKRQLR